MDGCLTTSPASYDRIKVIHDSIFVYNNGLRPITVNVLNGRKQINLLGREDSVRLGLLERVHLTVNEDSCKNLVTRYADVFRDTIGCMPEEYEIMVDEAVPPVIHPPRSVPSGVRQKVKEEFQRMEKTEYWRVTEPQSLFQ